MRHQLVIAAVAAAAAAVSVYPIVAQEPATSDPKDRIRYARSLARSGSENIEKLTPYLTDVDARVRLETVKSIVSIGSQHSLAPLIEALRDNDPQVRIQAMDGIVNFYVPGYIQTGWTKLGSQIRSRWDRENSQVVDPWVTVRPEAITAIGRVASGSASFDARARAARALGVLRGAAALPDLYSALHSKDDSTIYEALIAIQKIGDVSSGERVQFLLRDLHEPVQYAAIETVGILRTKEAAPQLEKIVRSTGSAKIRRVALSSLAMIGDPSSRELYSTYFTDKDEGMRASAAEGLARLKNAADRATVEQAFNDEKKMAARLALAFATVSLGHNGTGEFSPLTYLVNTLNSRNYRDVALPYLTELARDAEVRRRLQEVVPRGTAQEKIGLSSVLAATGDAGSVAALESLSKDSDPEVAREALRALRTLRARL